MPHHYPPRQRVSWAFRWVGMLLILVVAVVSVPGVVDGIAVGAMLVTLLF